MIMVYKHMMRKKRRIDVTNLGNLFIVDRIWTTLVALVSGGKLLLVLVKLVVSQFLLVVFPSVQKCQSKHVHVWQIQTREDCFTRSIFSLYLFLSYSYKENCWSTFTKGTTKLKQATMG